METSRECQSSPATYGHSLNQIGSRLYVFGGIEVYISNKTSQWEEILSNDIITYDLRGHEGRPVVWRVVPTDERPEARSQHIAVTWNGSLFVYLSFMDEFDFS